MNANGLRVLGVAPLLFCCLAAWGSEPGAADWPQWRGPNRNGELANSPKLLDTWPKEGPKLLWKAEFMHAGEVPKYVTDTGASSPVVADGFVYLFADWARNYTVTRKMLDEWGWADGVPDDLADKLEKTRVGPAKNLAGADLEKAIAEFLAALNPEDARKFGEVVRKRLTLGTKPDAFGHPPASWESMAVVVNSGTADKAFPTFEAWLKTKFKDKDLGRMLDGHADGNWGANAMMRSVVRMAERSDVICCLDADTGKQIWRKEYPGSGGPYQFYWFGGASGTPAVVDGKVYAAGGSGLYCLSAKDGKEIWKVGTTHTNCSPLVANGMVYVIFGRIPDPTSRERQTAEVRAYDALTGQFRWKQEKIGQTDGSPALWVHQGKHYLFIAAPGGLLCLDATTGAQLWKEKSVNIQIGPHGGNSTPTIKGDTVLVQGQTAYRLTPEKAEVLWNSKDGRTDYGAAGIIDKEVAYYGHGYTPFFCIDMATGKERWKTPPVDSPRCFSPILADGKIFLHDGKGSFLMIRASPEKYEPLGTFKASVSGQQELSYSISPCIANGRLYLRLRDHVVCYDLTEAGNR